MTVYLDLVVLLNFLVDLLLLIGTNRLSGYPLLVKRSALGALVGALYAGACVLPGFSFLGNFLWRIVSLICVAWIAFGWNKSAIRRGVLFVFLCMAMGGIATGLESGGFWVLVAAAAGVSILCLIGFRGRAGQAQYASVELAFGGERKKLTALLDTGNTLKDPISGEGVLVVGADVAWDMLGLSREALENPVETMQRSPIKGLRLIPYRAVGNPAGLMLGIHMDHVMINGRKSGNLVAFAPHNFGTGEGHQALAGGVI